MRQAICAFFLVGACFSLQAQNILAPDPAERCSPVLRLAARDESFELQQLKTSKYVYDQVCQGSRVRAGFNASSTASMLVDLVPFQGSSAGSGRYERAKEFCRTFNSQSASDLYTVGVSSTVVREAVTSWERCMTMNQAISISVNTPGGPEGVLVEIARGRDNFEFLGLKVLGESTMNCTSSLPVSNDGAMSNTVNETSRLAFEDSRQLSISCKRVPIYPSPGQIYYPPVAFTVATDRGSLALRLPDDRTGPDYVSQWQQEKAVLQATIDALQARTSKATLVCEGGVGWHLQNVRKPVCPANTTADQYKTHAYPGGREGTGWKCVVCSQILP